MTAGAFEHIGSEVAHAGVLSTVRLDQVRLPDGEVVEREIVEHLDAVAVVAIDRDGSVVLLRQYRPAVRDEVLEIPAGKLDEDGEEPVEAARRELLEETGLTAGDLEPLVTFRNSSGWTDEQTTVYLARDVVEGTGAEGFTAHGEEAHMTLVRMPFAEVLAAARRGAVTDAKTLVGILMAADRIGG